MGDLHGIWQTSGKIVPCYLVETIIIEREEKDRMLDRLEYILSIK